MEQIFTALIDRCRQAVEFPEAQNRIEAIVFEAVSDPDIVDAIARRTRFSSLEDLAIHRSEQLTLLAGSLPPGFGAAPHNHNLWSVVGVGAGQEDNTFFEREGDGLRQTTVMSVVAPGVLANPPDVIHSIRNPLDTVLVALHAYGGDLFAVARSNWDPQTHQEMPFDWQKASSRA